MPEVTAIDSLIQRCVNGDSSAWAEFVEHFSLLVFYTIKEKIDKLSLSLPESDIYDIYQQVFLSIWQKQKLKSIKNPSSIRRWLVIVTQNETFDYMKSRHFQADTETIGRFEFISDYTPRDETHRNELDKEIGLFIDTLPLKERRIGTLDIFYGLKYTQISKIVNLPLGTVSSVIKRIKTDLKQYLLKKGY